MGQLGKTLPGPGSIPLPAAAPTALLGPLLSQVRARRVVGPDPPHHLTGNPLQASAAVAERSRLSSLPGGYLALGPFPPFQETTILL